MSTRALPTWVMHRAHAVVGTRVGTSSSATVIKTPNVVSKDDLVAYINALDPFVQAFDSDIKTKTYNVSSEAVAKTISLARGDGASDERITNEVNLDSTWNGWGFVDSLGDPEHPGFYRTWSDMSDQVKSGILTKVWPWLVFGPAAGVFMVPTIIAAEAGGAEARGDQWNNIRDAHKRLAVLRKELAALGYTPSGDALPDIPADVGALGLRALGGEGGQGAARTWWERYGVAVLAGGLLVAGSIFIGQIRGVFRP